MHHISGFIAKTELLQKAIEYLTEEEALEVRLRPLRQGYSFLPDTYLSGERNTIGSALSRDGMVAFVETDYWGSGGEQRASLFENGKLIMRLEKSINSVLNRMGVERVTSDEFDGLGLGMFRSNEDEY